jgi:hypothetical protein
MLTRLTKVRMAASLAGAALVSFTTSAVSGAVTATPAYADDLVGADCVGRALVGADGYLHFSPNGRPDIDIKVPACPDTPPTPAATPSPTLATSAPAPRRTSTTRRTPARKIKKRTVCGTWWVRGRDARGRGGTRPGYRGMWHIVRECRRVTVR